MMRWFLAWIGMLCCALVLAQPDLPAGRGMDFQYAGPASEMPAALGTALGFGAEPHDLPKAIEGAEGEKPVAVDLKGARLFDIVCAIENELGHGVELSTNWMQPRLVLSQGAGRVASSPRASTPDCDVVLEKIDRTVNRRLSWDADGARAGQPWQSLILGLRTYPVDEAAAERLCGYKRPGLTLVHPDGKEDAIEIWPTWYNAGAPFARCLRSNQQPRVTGGDLPPGEYKLRGTLLVSKVDPTEALTVTAADLGRTLDLGSAKLTVRSWGGGQQPSVVWVLDGERPYWAQDDAGKSMLLGVVWVEVRGRGADGQVLWTIGTSTSMEDNRLVGTTYYSSAPASVEFRMLVVHKPEDLAQEPFEITFTLPADFLGP